MSEEIARQSRQLKLFHIENPLSVRLGNEFFRSLPSSPGVYFFYDIEDRLLYIGQSSDIKARVGSYRHVTPENNPRRTLRLVHRIFKIEWRTCATPAEAVDMEKALLLEHRPPFNRAGVWQGEPWWLIVEARENNIHLELNREENGHGPLPSGFRHIFGSLVRCLYRVTFPERPISQYPHGLLGPVVPLTLILLLPSIDEVVQIITDYVDGNSDQLMTRLEIMPLAVSESEQEYWLEEVERLKRYAEKGRKFNPPGINSRLAAPPDISNHATCTTRALPHQP